MLNWASLPKSQLSTELTRQTVNTTETSRIHQPLKSVSLMVNPGALWFSIAWLMVMAPTLRCCTQSEGRLKAGSSAPKAPTTNS